MTYTTIRTGRPRRPQSVPEWAGQRVAGLGVTAQARPAGRALIMLLDHLEDADSGVVKAVGRDLDEYGRKSVADALAQLVDAAQRSYPPAGQPVRRVREMWVKAWGDRELVPRRDWVAAKTARGRRPLTLADTGLNPDPAAIARSWEGLGVAIRAARPQGAGA